jgi:hypothetical protein
MLSEHSKIALGYKLAVAGRRPIAGDAWRVLQTRDFDDDGLVNWRLVATVSDDDRKLKACQTHPGDLLFAPRSPRLGAVLLGNDVANPRTAASSHFYIIRVDRDRLLPEYLVWYLNHPRTQDKLQAENRGTHLPFIPMDVIRRLDIALPSIERQRAIGSIEQLARHERHLAAELVRLHDEQRAAVMWRAAHSD